MADASALFAKKKGKKKKFKSFNANKAEVSDVFSSTHVDDETTKKKMTVTTEDTEWGEAEKKRTVVATGGAQLGEFSSLEDQVKIGEEVDISEKIRIEETRKQLEAVRLKALQGPEEPEKKKEEAPAAPAPPPTLANGGLSSLGGGGGSSLSSLSGGAGGAGKYVPKHRQMGSGASLSDKPPMFNTRFNSGNSAGIRKVDTSDEAAFPTLGGGKTVIASGAWGAPKKEEEETKKEETGETVFKFAEGEKEKEKEKEGEGEGEVKKEKKKKKKKDLSTFG